MDSERGSGEQGGGTALSLLLQNVRKRMYLAVRKRTVGKSVLGDEEQEGKKRHWGTAGLLFPGKKQWTVPEPGTN